MNMSKFSPDTTPAVLRPYDPSMNDSSNSAILKTTQIYEHNATPFPRNPRSYEPLVATMVLSGDSTIPSLNLASFNTEEIVASYCLPFEGKLHAPRRLDCSYPYPFQRLFCHDADSGLEAIDLLNDSSESDEAIVARSFGHCGYRKVGTDKRRVIDLLDATMADGKIWMWERDEEGRISVNRTPLDSEPTLFADDTIEVVLESEIGERVNQFHHFTNSTILRTFDDVHDLYDINKEVSVSAISCDELTLHSVSDLGYSPNSSNWPLRVCSGFEGIYFLFGGENEIRQHIDSSSSKHVSCTAFLSEYHVVVGGYTPRVHGYYFWENYIEYYDVRKEGKIDSFCTGVDTPSSFARHPFDSNRCLYAVMQLPPISVNRSRSCKEIQFDGSALKSHLFFSDVFEGLLVNQVLALDEPFNLSSGGRFSIPREVSLYLHDGRLSVENEGVEDCSNYPPFCCFGDGGLLFFDENLQLDGKVEFGEMSRCVGGFHSDRRSRFAIHHSKEIFAWYDCDSSTLILVASRQIAFNGEMLNVHQLGFLRDSIAIRIEDEGTTCLYDLMPQNDGLVPTAVIRDPDQVDTVSGFATDPETNSLFFVVPGRLVEYSVTLNNELEYLRDWEIGPRRVNELEVTSCYVKICYRGRGGQLERRCFRFRSLQNDAFDDEIWNSKCLTSSDDSFYSFVVNDDRASNLISGGQNAKRKMFALSRSSLVMPRSIPRQLPHGAIAPCFPKSNPSKKAQWLCSLTFGDHDGILQLCSSDNEVIKTIASERIHSIFLLGTKRLDYDPILFSSSTKLGGFLAVPIERKRNAKFRKWKVECQAKFDRMMNKLAVSIIDPTKNLKIEEWVAFNDSVFRKTDTQQPESVLLGDDLVAIKSIRDEDDKFWVTSRNICIDLQIPLHEESEKEDKLLDSMEEDNLECKVIESQLLAGVRFAMHPDELLQKTVDSLLDELDESCGVFGVSGFLNSLSVTTARMKPFNRGNLWVSAEILDDCISSAASDLKGSEFNPPSIPRETANYYLSRSVRGNVCQVPERFEIKLCASRLNDGARLPVVTRTLGSVGRFLGFKGASFGLVHVYPTIGPLRLHWDTSSKVTLTLERRQNVVVRLRLHELVCQNIAQQRELFSLFGKLARFIDYCNQNVSYDMQGDRKPNHHNCQTFSISVLKTLGGFKNRVPTTVYEYLTKTLPSLIAADESVRQLDLKKIQMGDFRFGQLFPGVVGRVSALGTGCKIQKSRLRRRLSWISFSTSAEVRLFMDLVEEKYCDFRFLFPGVWRLLEGFSTEDDEEREGLRRLRETDVIQRYVVAPAFNYGFWVELL